MFNVQCTLECHPPHHSFLPMAALTPVLLHLNPSYLTSYLSPQICYILSYLGELSYLKHFPTHKTAVLSCSLLYALESCLVLSFTWKSGGIATDFYIIIFMNCRLVRVMKTTAMKSFDFITQLQICTPKKVCSFTNTLLAIKIAYVKQDILHKNFINFLPFT